ncbi:MAG TPA: hypothetical protein VEX70_17435 [Pyrinomonadaceae bacterium]|nr:hypothetical protein [Pyrinomonadaceae bacterium]
MAKDQNKRITPGVLEADRNSVAALQGIAGYAPANPAYSLAAIMTLQTEMTAARDAEAQAAAALASARDTAAANEWEFHNRVLGVKDQVIAQFGRDSNEVQALGLKKTSERKAPVRRKAAAEVKA